jgi:hypothetical protein
MHEPEIENAKITAVKWDSESVLSHWIIVEGDGWGCGFGGYCLKGEACYDWITEVMRVLEISDFGEKAMIGKIVRAKHAGLGGGIIAIGHPIKDLWFEPGEFFKKYDRK